MTAMDHHSMIGDSNCTNSISATVKCACAAAAVVGAAVVVSVGLQMDRRLEHVAVLALLLHHQGVRCFCQHLDHQIHKFSPGKKCFYTVVFQ